jgi:hypothetical protein
LDELGKKNLQRAPVYSYAECQRQCNVRPNSARGLLIKALFEGPATLLELANRIGTLPPSGPNRNYVSATPERLETPMWWVGRRTEEVTIFRVVGQNGKFSVCLASAETPPRRQVQSQRIPRVL